MEKPPDEMKNNPSHGSLQVMIRQPLIAVFVLLGVFREKKTTKKTKRAYFYW